MANHHKEEAFPLLLVSVGTITMPLFLIPIAVGVWMYYEKQRKEWEEEQQSRVETDADKQTTSVPGCSTASQVSSDDHVCEEVIETRLSQVNIKGTMSISEQVEVTFEDTSSSGVPRRQESEVSDDTTSTSEEGVESQAPIPQSSDIEMVEMRKVSLGATVRHQDDVPFMTAKDGQFTC